MSGRCGWFRWRPLPAALIVAGVSLLALLPRPSFAQDFYPGVRFDFATGRGPSSVAIGDLNGDGRLDLAVANDTSGTVSALLGASTGGFGTKADFAVGAFPQSVAIGDLNGDGRLDLVAANANSNTVSVLLGDGAGGFGAKTDFVAGGNPVSVAVGDLNGDGRPDLAVANNSSGTVSVLIGDGAGGFGARTDFAAGSHPNSVAIRDVSGDGKLDLAVANYISNTVSVLLGNGAGGFGAKTGFATGNLPCSVVIGDVNGDGKPDLLTANSDEHTVSVLLGDGTGGFGAKTDFATGSVPVSVAIGDVSGDGIPDLAVANYNSNSVSVLLGDNGGGFGSSAPFATGSNPVSVAIGDVNGDGRPDLAVANYMSNTVSVLRDERDYGFGEAVPFEIGGALGPFSVAIGDVNGDGHPDLAAPVWWPGPEWIEAHMVSVLLGDGLGGFGAKSDFATGRAPRSVAIGDVNGDGYPDLAVANDSSASVSVLLGDGLGGFGARSDFGTGLNPWSVAIGDVSGDGKPDLVTANFGSNTVSVLLGNGLGGLGAKNDFGTGLQPISLALGELNGDGRLDLAVANHGSGTVSVLLGDGLGGFGAKSDYETGLYPRSLALGELNGDGRLDLAVANSGSSTVSVLLGNGLGGFGAKSDVGTGPGLLAVAIGDLTVDGKADLAVTWRTLDIGMVSVLSGDGTGSFEAASGTYIGGGFPFAVAVGDVNGDAHPDIAVAGHFDGRIAMVLAIPLALESSITLTSSHSLSLAGAPVVLQAAVSRANGVGEPPTGSVRFFDGTTLLGMSAMNSGIATLSVSNFPLGDRSLTAVYLGDATFFGRISTPVAARVVSTLRASISRVRDVRSDQGRQVRLYVAPSPGDYVGSPTPILRYGVYRRIDESLALEARAAAVADTGGPVRDEPTLVQIAGWDAVGSVDACADTIYSIVAPTLADSGATGTHWAVFFVRAVTSVPSVYYDSAPDSGYSVDNLPPPPPAPFTAAYASGATHLHWGASTEDDFWYYRLYRGGSADFTPGPGNIIAAQSDTGYVDPGPAGGYYKLSAVDVGGNESSHAVLGPVGATDVPSGGPAVFALEGVRPNPAPAGLVTVVFALAEAGPARLELLDVSGRRVAVREVGALGVGRHVVSLGEGLDLSPGLYLVRLTQGANVRVVRAAVLK